MGAPKSDEDLIDVYRKNYIRTVLGTRLIDRISKRRLHEKCGPVLLSKAIIRERMSWLRSTD